MSGSKSPLSSRRQILRGAGFAIGAMATSGLVPRQARAAGYPDRPVKIIVPFAPAGPTDIMARVLSRHLGEAIDGSVIIENKAGAGGNIGIGAAAHAEPDGYTLLVTSSAYVVNPGLYEKIPYDPYKDFAPIAELGTSPNVILVGPKLGINSIAELIARAKANPNELNYASPGIGTTPHLSGELLKIVGGIQITHVPFSGAGPRHSGGARRHHAAGLRGVAAGASLHRVRGVEGAGRHRRQSLVRSARRADHGRTRPQGFHRRHLPGFFGAGQNPARDRYAALDQCDQISETSGDRRAASQSTGLRFSPMGRTACASGSRTKSEMARRRHKGGHQAGPTKSWRRLTGCSPKRSCQQRKSSRNAHGHTTDRISVPLQNDVPADPPGNHPTIQYIDHQQGLPRMLQFFEGLKAEICRTDRAGPSRRCSSRPTTAPTSTRPGIFIPP